MSYPHIDARLEKGDHLAMFDTRYSRGILVGIFHSSEFADKVTDHFNGGDDEATSSDDWFLNGVYPSVAANTSGEALAKLEALLAKIAGWSDRVRDEHHDLTIAIVSGYIQASKPDRPMARIQMPADLQARIHAFSKLKGGEWVTTEVIGTRSLGIQVLDLMKSSVYDPFIGTSVTVRPFYDFQWYVAAGEVIAFYQPRIDTDGFHRADMPYVKPEFRRQGIISNAIKARLNGHTCRAWINLENKPSVALYESIGLTRTGATKVVPTDHEGVTETLHEFVREKTSC